MNAYEFIRKGYGTDRVDHLNLYIQITGEHPQYLVEQINNLDIRLSETLHNGQTATRFLGKAANLEVGKVLVDSRKKIIGSSKVILMLVRPRL